MDFDNLCHDESEVNRVVRHSVVLVRETQNFASLQAVDRLMWQQPDNALMVLVNFATFPKAVSTDVLDRHYCQMLLSELFY